MMSDEDKVREAAKALASAIVREAVWATYDAMLEIAEKVIEQELDRSLRGEEDGLFYEIMWGEEGEFYTAP